MPLGVVRFDEPQLPRTIPVFELSLTCDGVPDVVERLDMDEGVDAVTRREAGDEGVSMFVEPPDQVACHADVQGAVALARMYTKPGRGIEVAVRSGSPPSRG